MKKAVFIDRDGTLNADESGYIAKPEDFCLFDYSGLAIRELNNKGFFVFIITNQSGIARGLFDFSDLEIIHKKMLNELASASAEVDEIFVSPYHPEGCVSPYNIVHEDRKPGTGLFKKAIIKYNFEIKNSFMIGDKIEDVQFAKNTGLRSIMVRTGNGEKQFINERTKWNIYPDYLCNNLKTAVDLILKISREN